jgi:hypothetical protein
LLITAPISKGVFAVWLIEGIRADIAQWFLNEMDTINAKIFECFIFFFFPSILSFMGMSLTFKFSRTNTECHARNTWCSLRLVCEENEN